MLALTRRAGERVYLWRGEYSLRLEVLEARRRFAAVLIHDDAAGTACEVVLVTGGWSWLGNFGRVGYHCKKVRSPQLLLDCPPEVRILRGELVGRAAVGFTEERITT